jgi:hypothetical protein
MVNGYYRSALLKFLLPEAVRGSKAGSLHHQLRGIGMKNRRLSRREIVYKVTAMVLWALTTWQASYQIFLTRHIIQSLYLRLLEMQSVPITVLNRLSATATGNIASLIMAIIAIVIVVGGFDYHWSHAGERRSFVLFGCTFAFQIGVLVLYNWL